MIAIASVAAGVAFLGFLYCVHIILQLWKDSRKNWRR